MTMTTKDFTHELKTECMTDIAANRQFKPASPMRFGRSTATRGNDEGAKFVSGLLAEAQQLLSHDLANVDQHTAMPICQQTATLWYACSGSSSRRRGQNPTRRAYPCPTQCGPAGVAADLERHPAR
jgi:hypothetical protein